MSLLGHLDLAGLKIIEWDQDHSSATRLPHAPHSIDVLMVRDFTHQSSMADLERGVSLLKEDGVLLLAAENPVGFQYWSGVPEPLSGRLFESICGADGNTRSRKFWRDWLAKNGLNQVEEQYVFPHPRSPSTVLTGPLIQAMPDLAAELATAHPYATPGQTRFHCFPAALAMQSIARAGLLPGLANSFLWIATKNASSPTFRQIQSGSQAQAWHYSQRRKIATQTTFFGVGGAVETEKSTVSANPPPQLDYSQGDFKLTWQKPPRERVKTGRPVRLDLMLKAYGADWPGFQARLEDFLSWSLQTWAIAKNRTTLQGDSLDAVFGNALIDNSSGPAPYELFDLEWKLKGEVSASWFVFRNVFALGRFYELFNDQAPFDSLLDLYEGQCRKLRISPQFEKDADAEALFQKLVSGDPDVEPARSDLAQLFTQKFGPSLLPQNPDLEVEMRSAYPRLKEEMRMLPHRAIQIAKRVMDRIVRSD